MENNQEPFKFEISLSVLNHLGRNLYRNFITVLGEAISNSWDADAKNVWIYIDRERSTLVVKDDGVGMTSTDFAEKFLTVGYSKRKNGDLKSKTGRPFIGAKGIGKLALLSSADTISIISKTSETEYIGGVIDNAELDTKIEDDVIPSDYPLGQLNMDLFKDYIDGHEKGTIIYFENVKEDIRNTVVYLKKMIALHFRFSVIGTEFNIYVNNVLITLDDIKELSDKTEILWNINELQDEYISRLTELKHEPLVIASSLDIEGFVATVEKPRNLKITGTEERVGIDLFVNGRLREKDLMKHIPTARVTESYMYGQIHYNALDEDGVDRFTSSREGVQGNDEKYQELLKELKETIIPIILREWDKIRLEIGKDGDDDDPRKTPKARRARSLYNLSANDYKDSENDDVGGWIKELTSDAEFNIPAYTECFLAENLLRKRIEDISLIPVECVNFDTKKEQSCIDRYNPKTGKVSLCYYCKGEKRKNGLSKEKVDAGMEIPIRVDEGNILSYLDYIDLANTIDNKILTKEDKTYRPLRNSVMHTSRLTREGKTKLTSVFDNVIATVKKIISK